MTLPPVPGPRGRNLFVLSGGGSRGAAQVGMLRALLGNHVAPDLLVGSSVGALNSCFLAANPTSARVEELADRWQGMTSASLLGQRIRARAASNLLRRRPYLFDAEPIRAIARDWIAVPDLADLAVPVRVATTDLTTGRPVHHDSGPLEDVLAATTALPGVFPPVRLPFPAAPDRAPACPADTCPVEPADPAVQDSVPVTNQIDGGVAENVPLSAVAGLVCEGDRLWVLDVSRPGGKTTLRSPVDVLIAALAGQIRSQPPVLLPAAVEVVRVELDPEFDSGTVLDFTHARRLIRLGETAADRALDALR